MTTTNTLSKREHEVLNLIAYEYSSKQIAHLLYIGKETVKSHRKNLMKKLSVANTAGLVRKGMELDLIKQDFLAIA